MQKHVNLVDLVKSFPTNIYLQKLASIQKRTSPLKFAHLAEKSEKGSISNLSTKVRGDSVPAVAVLPLHVPPCVLLQVPRAALLLFRVRPLVRDGQQGRGARAGRADRRHPVELRPRRLLQGCGWVRIYRANARHGMFAAEQTALLSSPAQVSLSSLSSSRCPEMA